MKPWEHYRLVEKHYEQPRPYSHHMMNFRRPDEPPSSYIARFETVRDNAALWWRKGDVIQFGSGFMRGYIPSWKRWFLETKDMPPPPINKKIPIYARDEYAIILNRYRWKKFKWNIFIDYGVILMMLTGSKAGNIRRYYASSYPFDFVKRYPYTGQRKYIGVKLDTEYNLIHTLKNIKSKFDKEEARDLFLSCIYHVVKGTDPNEPEIEKIANEWLTR